MLVAAQDLSTGTLVRREHLRWQEWDNDSTLPNTFVIRQQTGASVTGRSELEFQGSVVRRSLQSGQPIVEGSMVKPGEQGFLAAVIQPGREAISLEISGSCGVAGFIFPGDRVNMMVIHDMPRRGEEGVRNRVASETVMRNVRVLAVDQSANDITGVPKLAKFITLEVTSAQAEIVSIMPRIGQICFSLNGIVAGENAILADAEPVKAEFEEALSEIKVTVLEPDSPLTPEAYARQAQESGPFTAFDVFVNGNNSGLAWDREVSSVRRVLSEEVPRVRLIRGQESSEVVFNN